MEPLNHNTLDVFAVDKPYGWTSFDAVKKIRCAIQRKLGVKKYKIGHAGTLDPLATGILIICTGPNTKKIEELQSGDKEYIATIRFGATTPSYDLEKEIDRTFPYEHITPEIIKETLPRFTGKIMQVPPVFSAVKIDGKRAYKFARKGEEIELKPKPLEIKEMEMTDWNSPDLTLRIVCGKGTYIRALARDLGEALGSGAHLTALRRTRVGKYDLAKSYSLDELMEKIENEDSEKLFPQNKS